MRPLHAGALATALLLVVGAMPAVAAAPVHETIRGTAVDPDFCGTGEAVAETFVGAFNGWEDQAFGHIRTTWTNPANGIAVYDSFSGGGKLTFIDDGDGAYTIQVIREGQPFRLQYVGGPLILQDAGLIIAYDHFDAEDNYLGTDVVVTAGPHPARGVDWCALMVELLEL
jgi:hypothetical protein